MMSSLVSSIMPSQKTDYLIHWENYPEQKDPDFFLDLKAHLHKNAEYRKERKEFYKLHPGWSLYKARDEFAKEYSEIFLKDVEVFVHAHPDMNAGEATRAFCSKWKGYSNVYGENFVLRAVMRLM